MSWAEDEGYDGYGAEDINNDTGEVIWRKRLMKTRGVVSEVFGRDWEGRDGTIVLRSFQLEGDKKFYRTGEKELVKAGDSIEFEFDGKGNVDFDSVARVDAPVNPAPKSAPVQKSFGGGGGGGGFKAKQAEKDKYWADKEDRQINVVEPRITWSSAQSDAVRIVGLALEHDLLAFGNANKGAKLGLLLDYVDQVTARFAAQRWNAAKLVADAVSIDSEAVTTVPQTLAAGNDDGLG